MIEINTIQDIRQIESKLIGGFSARQLISFLIGTLVGIVTFFITHSTFLVILIAGIIIGLGVFKKGNLTAIEYIKLLWNKQQQPNVRIYKNKNIISEIEKQCLKYKSPKKKSKK